MKELKELVQAVVKAEEISPQAERILIALGKLAVRRHSSKKRFSRSKSKKKILFDEMEDLFKKKPKQDSLKIHVDQDLIKKKLKLTHTKKASKLIDIFASPKQQSSFITKQSSKGKSEVCIQFNSELSGPSKNKQNIADFVTPRHKKTSTEMSQTGIRPELRLKLDRIDNILERQRSQLNLDTLKKSKKRQSLAYKNQQISLIADLKDNIISGVHDFSSCLPSEQRSRIMAAIGNPSIVDKIVTAITLGLEQRHSTLSHMSIPKVNSERDPTSDQSCLNISSVQGAETFRQRRRSQKEKIQQQRNLELQIRNMAKQICKKK